MARARTGTIVRYEPATPSDGQGHYVVRCSAPDGSRPIFHLDPSPKSPQGEARARETAAAISEQLWARGLGAAPLRRRAAETTTGGPEYAAWLAEWHSDRERRGLVRSVASNIDLYIAPATGNKHVRDWTGEDLRALVRLLDTKVQAGEISWKTATNIWGTATCMCWDACSAKVESLRIREDNPSLGVAGPDRGIRKEKQFLYPSEFLRFVECEAIPLAWRRAVAAMVYLYPRPSELRALMLGDDVDLDHGVVHIHRSLDGAGNAKPTKTKTPRRFAIEPELLPLLVALHRSGAGHVELPARAQNLSVMLKKMLTRAGITRPELHETTATRKGMTFYDLRATGITWMAVRGDDPLKIMQRAGHENFSTTQGYIRTAEAVRTGFGEPFPALPLALLPSVVLKLVETEADAQSSRQSSRAAQVIENRVRRRGLEPPWELPR
ncbi:MAG: tyrosine-type recombinase/integrase [Myxococcales bacterium]|nr:tyrosine-type recombinase/integrase [Myxococcales bacterium]